MYDHSALPDAPDTPYNTPLSLPTYTDPLNASTTGDDRIARPLANHHATVPSLPSSPYSRPSSQPTNTRPKLLLHDTLDRTRPPSPRLHSTDPPLTRPFRPYTFPLSFPTNTRPSPNNNGDDSNASDASYRHNNTPTLLFTAYRLPSSDPTNSVPSPSSAGVLTNPAPDAVLKSHATLPLLPDTPYTCPSVHDTITTPCDVINGDDTIAPPTPTMNNTTTSLSLGPAFKLRDVRCVSKPTWPHGYTYGDGDGVTDKLTVRVRLSDTLLDPDSVTLAVNDQLLDGDGLGDANAYNNPFPLPKYTAPSLLSAGDDTNWLPMFLMNITLPVSTSRPPTLPFLFVTYTIAALTAGLDWKPPLKPTDHTTLPLDSDKQYNTPLLAPEPMNTSPFVSWIAALPSTGPFVCTLHNTPPVLPSTQYTHLSPLPNTTRPLTLTLGDDDTMPPVKWLHATAPVLLHRLYRR